MWVMPHDAGLDAPVGKLAEDPHEDDEDDDVLGLVQGAGAPVKDTNDKAPDKKPEPQAKRKSARQDSKDEKDKGKGM